MHRKVALGFYGMIGMAAVMAVLVTAEKSKDRPRPERNKTDEARPAEQRRREAPPQVKKDGQAEEKPAGEPSKVNREPRPEEKQSAPQPEQRRYVAPERQQSSPAPSEPRRSESDARRGAPPAPLTTQGRNVVAPRSQPPALPNLNRDNRSGGSYGYDGRGGYYPRTFHGRHDRWRYDRFSGSWDFLIFPGPIVYSPQPYYAPRVSTSHIAVVHVEYSGNDATGSSFIGALDDQLRQNEMGPAASAGDASLQLYIISMDEDPSDPGYGSAVSVSYVLMPEYQFITSQLLDVGSEQVDDLAASVVSYARQLLDEYR
jgi:hypothetical protein